MSSFSTSFIIRFTQLVNIIKWWARQKSKVLIELTYENLLYGVVSPVSRYLSSFPTYIHAHTPPLLWPQWTLQYIFKYVIFSSGICKFASTGSAFPCISRAPFRVLRPSSNATTYMVWWWFLFAADSHEETFSLDIEIDKREISDQRNVIFLRLHLNQPFVIKSFSAFKLQPQWN